MITVAKSTPIGSLGLSPGDHLVRVHVGQDTVSLEIETPGTVAPESPTAHRQATGFLSKWGGTARKMADPSDDWLTHINEKHLH